MYTFNATNKSKTKSKKITQDQPTHNQQKSIETMNTYRINRYTNPQHREYGETI